MYGVDFSTTPTRTRLRLVVRNGISIQRLCKFWAGWPGRIFNPAHFIWNMWFDSCRFDHIRTLICSSTFQAFASHYYNVFDSNRGQLGQLYKVTIPDPMCSFFGERYRASYDDNWLWLGTYTESFFTWLFYLTDELCFERTRSRCLISSTLLVVRASLRALLQSCRNFKAYLSRWNIRWSPLTASQRRGEECWWWYAATFS